MKTIAIKGELRNQTGKKAAAEARRNEQIPCVLYSSGDENVHFNIDVVDFNAAIFTPDFHKIELELDGNKVEAVVKAVQYHPVKDSVEHVDFLRLKSGELFTTSIPVRLEGQAAGAKAGGKVQLKLRKLNVRLTPDAIVDRIAVNIESLELGKSIRVGDVNTGNIEVLNNPGNPIATCEVPRALKGKTAEGEGEEGAEAAEGAEAEAAAE